MKNLFAILCALAFGAISTPVSADDRAIEATVVEHEDGMRTLVHTAIVDAPPARVWEAFSTLEGWKSWGVAFAVMDVRPGGTIESSYVPGATAGDPNNIVHRILAIIPERLMVMRIEQAPEGGPVGLDVLEEMWAVYELEALPDGRTKLTISGHGYGAGQPYDGMLAYFVEGNKIAIEAMRTTMEVDAAR